MPLAEVLDVLEYSQSPYYRKTTTQQGPELASLFRSAQSIGVDGIYVIRSSNEENPTFSARPAVYVAQASTPEEAQAIHCSVWNLGDIPFLIVVLPDHIRAYTGFDYSRKDSSTGMLEAPVTLDRESILQKIGDFCADSIDTGRIWQTRSEHLKLDQRIDRRLLKNLKFLGAFLRAEMQLPLETAHALIGKYVYIRYLYDRGILSDRWFQQHDIDVQATLGRNATVESLRRLCAVLDERFNGSIFPLDFRQNTVLKDTHVKLVAAIFKGDEPLSGGMQPSLDFEDFQVYNFAYIPIELLSSIYEQFLHALSKDMEQGQALGKSKGAEEGAYYTPKYLADYLISEMSAVHPLREGMKILDPSCGSGIFLVLVYERLIEMRLATHIRPERTLPLKDLVELLQYMYGIERERDACYVAEFSLILMLLHYADMEEFLHTRKFKLPTLHNTQIFQYDFFDGSSAVWTKNMRFDWIIGNPPWISASHKKQSLAAAWINANSRQRPVGNLSVAEAFSWHVLDLLSPEGYAGLLLPAAILYNSRAVTYRQTFFVECEVRRMTDFSNLRKELFEGRANAPATTIIYHKVPVEQAKAPIEHYGPFALNQITKSYKKLWTITLNEYEFQTVSPFEAERGDSITWLLALWGTHRDKRAIAGLRKFFPQTLGQLYEEKKQEGWHLHEGSQLRNNKAEGKDKLKLIPELVGKKRLNTEILNESGYLFSIPIEALEDIPREESNIRIRGGEKGLLVSDPPHIIINDAWKYCIYSDTYFVINPRQIGLSAPKLDADYLKALSVFLSSSLIKYYVFFQSPRWGMERDVTTLHTVKSIPIPVFTSKQREQFAAFYTTLAAMEYTQGIEYTQARLDEQIAHIFELPEDITTLVTEFVQLRSNLVSGGTEKAVQAARRYPDEPTLYAYAQQLTHDLDGFLASSKTRHRVTIEYSQDLICCTIEFVRSDHTFIPIVQNVLPGDQSAFHRLQANLKQQFSQWVYVQRGLKIFNLSSVSVFKIPHLINWTRTQAMNDAGGIIGEILSKAEQKK